MNRIFRQDKLNEKSKRKRSKEETKQVQSGKPFFRMERLDSRYPDCPLGYIPLLSLIIGTIGLEKVKGAEILEFGPEEERFCDFLNRRFGAKAEATERRAQWVNKIFNGRTFDLIIGNNVFERDAFVHDTFEKDFELEQPLAITGSVRGRRKWVRQERTNILKTLAEHLKPGGRIIITGVSSKTIFHPDEITRAGLIIQLLNMPTQYIYATVLSRPIKRR